MKFIMKVTVLCTLLFSFKSSACSLAKVGNEAVKEKFIGAIMDETGADRSDLLHPDAVISASGPHFLHSLQTNCDGFYSSYWSGAFDFKVGEELLCGTVVLMGYSLKNPVYVDSKNWCSKFSAPLKLMAP